MNRIYPILFYLGRIFSPFYSFIMTLRAFLYRKNLFLKSHRLPVPVVSIGNLTLGGTGKTPLVMYVARSLQGMGQRPVIVSRGYKGKTPGAICVVSDGAQTFLSPREAGDEPALLAESLKGVPVLIGPERVAVGKEAIRRFHPDNLILDDGFQHLALHRDLDLVLFNARKLLGSGWVFPGGELREPFSALKRAHAFVITGVDNTTRRQVDGFKRLLRGVFPEAPVFLGEYLPSCLIHSQQTKTFPIDKAKRLPLYGFAGIANPDSFHYTLEKERFLLTGFQNFADHHDYSVKEVSALIDAARARRARALITTEKDFVKLRPYFGEFPVLALRVELFMEEGFDLFLSDWAGSMKRL
jgi:tetraacyldisaccharide 4'-kinase